MNSFVRTGFSRLTSWLFVAFFVLFATSVALNNTVTQPQKMKNIVKNSGAYDAMSKVAINAVVAQKDSVDILPLDNPAIVGILGQVFTADRMQGLTEVFINNAYLWLNGDAKSLPLSFDVSQSKQDAIGRIGDFVQNRFESLPLCTTRAQILAGTDLFVGVCRPPGVDIAPQRAQLEQQLQNSQAVPSVLGLSEATTGRISQAQTILDATSQIPSRYQQLQQSVYWLLGACAIMLGLSVGLRQKERLAYLGKTMLRGGLAVLLVGLVTAFLSPQLTNGLNLGVSQASDTVLLPIIKTLLAEIGKIEIIIGAIIAVVGAGVIIANKRRSSKETTR